MNFSALLKAVGIKLCRRFRVRSMSLTKSYISVFLCFALALTFTFSWFSIHDGAEIVSENFFLESAASMRANQGIQISSNISINDFKLDEATSFDGRNMFFPAEGYFTTTTANMKFRDGNVGDRNVRYVYKDFTLSNSSSKTNVFIKGYKIQIGDQTYQDEIEIKYENGKPKFQIFPLDCPLRIAFIDDSNAAPKMIDPAARVKEFAKSTNAVDTIDSSGTPTTQTTDPESFSSFYYPNGKPLFTLNPNEKKRCTMVVWLEGTTGDCDSYIGKTISVDVDIESNFDDFETISFIDYTIGDGGEENVTFNDGTISSNTAARWIGQNQIVAMSYEDTVEDQNHQFRYKTVILDYIGTEGSGDNIKVIYRGLIRKDAVTKISFYRLGKDTQTLSDGRTVKGMVYNAWHTMADINTMINSDISNWREVQKNQPLVGGSYQTGDNRKQLQESRVVRKTVDGGTEDVRSVEYTARRGNGYGNLSDNGNKYAHVGDNASNPLRTTEEKMEHWLAPCIGYWDYDPVSGGSTPSTGTTYTVNISVNTTDFPYVETETSLSSGASTMWMTLKKPNSDDVLEVQLDKPNGATNRFTKDGYKLEKDTEITKMYLKRPDNSKENFDIGAMGSSYPYTATTYKFTNNNNPTFNLRSNGSNNKIMIPQ